MYFCKTLSQLRFLVYITLCYRIITNRVENGKIHVNFLVLLAD